MEEGARGPRPDEPRVIGIDVSPAELVLARGAQQQLTVTARLSDGHTRDVTSLACFESAAREMADVNASGHVQLGDVPGDVTVMARFGEHVGGLSRDHSAWRADRREAAATQFCRHSSL